MISTEQRQIIFLSPLFEGKTHDITMVKTCFPMTEDWFSSKAMLADLGFKGLSNYYTLETKIELPHKKPRKSKKNPNPSLTKKQKSFNRRQAQDRIVVEHAIGGMKHFQCLTQRIRNHSMELIDQFFALSAGLFNYKIT